MAKQYANAANSNARISLHDRYSTNKYGWLRWVFDQIRASSHGKIFELGCGSGELWVKNADRIPNGWIITLTDMSDGMVEQAKKNLSQVSSSFRFAQIDAESIDMDDEVVDVVIANNMLYHVPNRLKAYSEIRRILRPAGELYAATYGSTKSPGIPALVKQIKSDAYDAVPENNSLFGLENGAGQLSNWFVDVEVLKYEDSLLIAEADPLVEYVRSTQRLNEEEIVRFRELVQVEISRNGVIRVAKNTGMFRARKKLRE